LSIFCYNYPHISKQTEADESIFTRFLPADFDCCEAVRIRTENKLATLEAITYTLPVYIVHDIRNSSVVYLSEKGLGLLGVTLEEVLQRARALKKSLRKNIASKVGY